MIKLDLAKAYDSFLKRVLFLLGFVPKWIHWFMKCISSTSFSVLINGSSKGLFHPTRGLWQGDSLSPFLFITGADLQSRLTLFKEQQGYIARVKINRNGPRISHLMYADDILPLAKANVRNAVGLKALARCVPSMFWIWKKTTIHFSRNSHPDTKHAIVDILLLKKWLSALGTWEFLFSTWEKEKNGEELIQKMHTHLAGWKAKALSQVGRTTLIRSVLSARPSYPIVNFLSHKYLLKNWFNPEAFLVGSLTRKN